jgi:hypothetical protein
VTRRGHREGSTAPDPATISDVRLMIERGDFGRTVPIKPSNPVRVRVPTPDKQKLIRVMRRHAADRAPSPSPQGCLEFYISCMRREIGKQELEAARAAKRIERYRECIAVAQEAIKELDAEEA